MFEQINEVYGKIEGLQTAIARLNSGDSGALAFRSAPSVAQFIVARATVAVRQRFPDLYIDLNVLKIEETVDYLMLERGEFVAMSYAFAHPSLDFTELEQGELVAVVPDGHALATRRSVSVKDLALEPLIGVSPDDPYGSILATPFRQAGLEYRLSIRARFAQTVVSLVRHGLGVAVIDEFSVAGVQHAGRRASLWRRPPGCKSMRSRSGEPPSRLMPTSPVPGCGTSCAGRSAAAPGSART